MQIGESFLELALDAGAHAAVASDPDGRISYWNAAAELLYGYTAAEAIGQSAAELLLPDDQRARAREAVGWLEDGKSVERDWRVRAKDGREFMVHVATTPVFEDGSYAGALALASGVSARRLTAGKKADVALRQSQDRYRAIAEAAHEGIWAVDKDGHTLYANRMVAEILGVPMRTLDEHTAIELLDRNGSTFIADKLRSRRRRGPEKYELKYQHPDGGSRSLRFSASPLLSEDGAVSSLAMIADVTEARRGEEELRRRALHDPLTGLANRTLLMDRLSHALNRRHRKGSAAVAVILADLEQFKLVNDTWGHAVGDQLLQQVAGRLCDAVREGDTVARFGGDEFAIVTEDSDESQALELAVRLRDMLALPFDVAGHRAHVSASVGIAVSPPQPGADLLRFADAAMYEAKAIGPGRIQMFDIGVAGRTADRLGLSGDLRAALSEDHLRVHYQPLVDLATGAVVGVEALARWTHPERGEVDPTQFVAVAEATGLAPALDQWVLSRVCADLAQLRSFLGDEAPIAVNISARHLGDADLDDHIAAALRASGASGHGLALEITETALMVNLVEAREVLEQLRGRGLRILVDDFGTGYSSLANLTRLPVDSLKIDRGFVEHITDDPDALAITAYVINLAQKLRLTTVAEGVETAEQMAMLHRLGCTTGQGFLWSPALPLDDLEAMLRAMPGLRFPVGAVRPRDLPRPPRGGVVAPENGLHHLTRMHGDGVSLTSIAASLNGDGFRRPDGTRWHRASVARVIADTIYPNLWQDAPTH